MHPTSLATTDSPPADPRDSAWTLAQQLEWSPGAPPAWGAVATILFGLLTFGIWPLLVWQARFRDWAADEARPMVELANWLKQHSTSPHAGRLPAMARRLQARGWLAALGLACVAGVLTLFVLHLAEARVDTPAEVYEAVLDATYRFPAQLQASGAAWPEQRGLFAFWTVGMAAGYLFHLMQVRGHSVAMQEFIGGTNLVLGYEDQRPVAVPRATWGIRIGWIVAAVVALWVGAYWGVAMVLAGAAQRAAFHAPRALLRHELSRRVQAMAVRQAARVVVRPPVVSSGKARVCPHPACRKEMAPQALFCSRCGTPLRSPVDRVA